MGSMIGHITEWTVNGGGSERPAELTHQKLTQQAPTPTAGPSVTLLLSCLLPRHNFLTRTNHQFPNHPASKKLPVEQIFWGTDPLGASVGCSISFKSLPRTRQERSYPRTLPEKGNRFSSSGEGCCLLVALQEHGGTATQIQQVPDEPCLFWHSSAFY